MLELRQRGAYNMRRRGKRVVFASRSRPSPQAPCTTCCRCAISAPGGETSAATSRSGAADAEFDLDSRSISQCRRADRKPRGTGAAAASRQQRSQPRRNLAAEKVSATDSIWIGARSSSRRVSSHSAGGPGERSPRQQDHVRRGRTVTNAVMKKCSRPTASRHRRVRCAGLGSLLKQHGRPDMVCWTRMAGRERIADPVAHRKHPKMRTIR